MKTMDFFGRQQRARRNTALLVALFVLALILMIAAIYVAVVITIRLSFKGVLPLQLDWVQPDTFAVVALATLSVVALGSLQKTLELRRGGEQVAVTLGGRLINSADDDHTEQRLLNVVEEMALASGVAVPAVYVLDREYGINAFAAGLAPDDAVVAVSRGTLEHLSRDELQGVVAHEFSHILNGDMRFNLRLIGILHGILVVGLIGYYIMHMDGGSRGGSNRGKGAGRIVLLGLLVMVIGYLGLFFGRVIKAAVSRQREYLADAAAVQFTRNPTGIGGALKKIGGLVEQSDIESPAVETASHLFFGSAIRWSAHSPFATHPPLLNRVRAIDPQFNGNFPRIKPLKRPPPPAAPQTPAKSPPDKVPVLDSLFPGLGFGDRVPIDPAMVLAAVGAPTTEHVAYSSKLISSLPERLNGSAREPFGARCIVFALLLDSDDHARQQQLNMLNEQEGAGTANETARAATQLESFERRAMLPLVEIIQGTLRQLSPQQYRRFRQQVFGLIGADEKVSLFEFIMKCVLLNHLDRVFGLASSPPVRYYGIRGVAREVAVVMSAVAHLGHRDVVEARRAYAAAMASLSLDNSVAECLDRRRCSLSRVKSSLDKLATCSMPIKKRVLGAAVLCVAVDRTVTVGEAELLRAVASSLDCPVPPILPGKVSTCR